MEKHDSRAAATNYQIRILAGHRLFRFSSVAPGKRRGSRLRPTFKQATAGIA